MLSQPVYRGLFDCDARIYKGWPRNPCEREACGFLPLKNGAKQRKYHKQKRKLIENICQNTNYN